MFHVQCCTQGIELTLEFGAIVSSDFGGISENLEHFFFYCISHRLAGFVLDEGQHAKFAETADSTEHVYFTGGVAQTNNQV